MIVQSTGRQALLGLMLLAVVGVSLTAAPGLDGVLGAFLGALMLAIAASDFRRYIIPNELTGAALALALFRAGAAGPEAGWEALIWAAGRGLAIALPFLALMTGYRWWRGRDGLGLGDIKLAAVAGAWLNFVTVFAVVELATLSALGAYFVSGYLRKRPLKATARLPFGLFLAPAIWIGWLVEAMLR
ncbi:A24 family peptidase [Bradyrhizobium sp. Ash2021]|uniref:A24 family peptidase n=1 Tax=Bradyrhizobium sp. Ash2021 TaxID=2954771 RepID=UPI002814BF7B|nr:A24 family peptidase [Bradyrhizobium sp. Ash2021]WMT72594.1 A24 family peptidase [Bradyrhizobium sp. Ash2021]